MLNFEEIGAKRKLEVVLWEFADIVKVCLIEGKSNVADHNLNIYYELRNQFNIFVKSIEDKLKDNNWTAIDFKTKMENSRGREIIGFLNFGLFRDMIAQHVDKYKLDMVRMANGMQKILEKSLIFEFRQFLDNLPELKKDVNRIIVVEVKEAMTRAIKEAERLLAQEHIVYTHDALFIQEMGDIFIRNPVEQLNGTVKRTSEYISIDTPENIELMKKSFMAYMKLVNKRLMDIIPLNMMQNLVVDLQKQLHKKIIDLSMDTSQENVLRRIKETSGLTDKRLMLTKQITRLKLAHEKLMEF